MRANTHPFVRSLSLKQAFFIFCTDSIRDHINTACITHLSHSLLHFPHSFCSLFLTPKHTLYTSHTLLSPFPFSLFLSYSLTLSLTPKTYSLTPTHFPLSLSFSNTVPTPSNITLLPSLSLYTYSLTPSQLPTLCLSFFLSPKLFISNYRYLKHTLPSLSPLSLPSLSPLSLPFR